MNDEELKNAIDLVKNASEALTDTKKDAQHLRNALNTIIKAGKDYEFYNKNYDSLLVTYTNNWVALRALSDLLHLEVTESVKLNDEDTVKYHLNVTIGKDSFVIDLTQEQFLAMARSTFISNPSNYKREK